VEDALLLGKLKDPDTSKNLGAFSYCESIGVNPSTVTTLQRLSNNSEIIKPPWNL
jgi:hypothetical protein